MTMLSYCISPYCPYMGISWLSHVYTYCPMWHTFACAAFVYYWLWVFSFLSSRVCIGKGSWRMRITCRRETLFARKAANGKFRFIMSLSLFLSLSLSLVVLSVKPRMMRFARNMVRVTFTLVHHLPLEYLIHVTVATCISLINRLIWLAWLVDYY